MTLQQRNIVSISFVSIFLFAGIIEIINPAPKISDYCTSSSCLTSAKDILVGTSEDYFGNLVPWLIGIFIVGILSIIFTFALNKKSFAIILETALVVDVLLYTIVSRFFHFFSRWPTQSWVVIMSALLIFGLILTYPLKRRSS
jgi:signal transduction histidine kinase